MEATQLNEMAALAAQYVNTTDRHIFLTGKAGTGKTTFLHYIVAHTYKNAVVAAPTGIAAINAGGVTLHSLLQLPFGSFIPEDIPLPEGRVQVNTPRTLSRQRRFRKEKLQLLRELDLLIIDEVSMLRADLLDCIDQVLRQQRRRWHQPFGGVQLLLIGDLMQLPPVVREAERPLLQRYYDSMYFFSAQALRQQPPLTVELRKIYRQSDQAFIDMLNRLRHNELDPNDVQRLNQHFQPDPPADGYIHLTTHNYKADRINQQRLKALPTSLRDYEAEIEGDFPENLYPLPATLSLKEGAQVMFIKNDVGQEKRFFNGKLGKIARLGKESVVVACDDGTEVEVEHHAWDNLRFELNQETNQVEEKVIGTFRQYPLKLAWAVTVHKSQGLTFEKAILDVSDTFAPGQLYVALSRLTSLQGLVLSSPLPTRPPAIDAALRNFVASFEDESDLAEQLAADQQGFLSKMAEQAFGLKELTKALREHAATFTKAENRSIKQQYEGWTQKILGEVEQMEATGGRFVRQFARILQQEGMGEHLSGRCEKALSYFEPQLLGLIGRVKTQRGQLQKEKKVKGYQEELEALDAALAHQCRQMMKLTTLVSQLVEGKMPSKAMLAEWEKKHRLNAQPPKPVKKPTAEVSLEHFEAGATVAEIAEERGLTEGTIYGHLTHYVAKGRIPLSRLLDESRQKIIEAALAQEYEKLSEVKERLGEEVGYNEIRLVQAYLKAQAELEQTSAENATQ